MCDLTSVKMSLPALFSGTLLMATDGAESLRQDGHDDKRENAPSIVVRLFEVRLLSTSQLLMVCLVLKHMGSSYYFLFCHFPLDTGISSSVSMTAADGSTILWRTQTNTNTKCLPSRPAHLIEIQL